MKWATYTMQELINEISMGPFGSDIKKSVYTNSGVPVLNGANLQGFTLKENTFGYVSEEKADSLKKCNAHRGDIIVTHRGTLGQIVYIPNNSLFERYVISQSQFRFNLKPELARAEFIVYYFHTREGQYKILSNASQVGVPALARATTTFRQLEVKVPPLPVQDEIVGILSALDSKIENNNKINANLESQAQALFKSWFVDFTPFKDQPFVDSELGPIPQGWKVGKYEDIILDTLAGDWGKEKITGNYTHEVACVRGCDFQDMNNGYRGNTPQRYILEKNYSTKRLLPQDLIIEISGGTLTVSTGRACLVSKEMLEKYDNNLVCTNFCKVIRPIDGYSAYCYYSWLHKYNNRVMFGYENGSSGLKNFRFKDFLTKEPLLIPPKADLIKFQHIIKLLQQKKQTNGTESTKLAALRDTLLPKLMSGEIKL